VIAIAAFGVARGYGYQHSIEEAMLVAVFAVVMIGIITLYQDWLPFGLALGYVGGLACAVEVGADPRRVRSRRQRRLPGRLAAQRDPGDRDQPAGQPSH